MTPPTPRTSRLFKRILPVLGIVGLGIAAAVYFGSRHLATVPEQIAAPAPNTGGMLIDGVHQSAARDGRTEWILDARSATYFSGRKNVSAERAQRDVFSSGRSEILPHRPAGHGADRQPRHGRQRGCRDLERHRPARNRKHPVSVCRPSDRIAEPGQGDDAYGRPHRRRPQRQLKNEPDGVQRPRAGTSARCRRPPPRRRPQPTKPASRQSTSTWT